MAKDFKSLATILKELPAEEQSELADRILDIVSSIKASDVNELLARIKNNHEIRLQVINALKEFLTIHYNLSIQ